MLAHVLHEIRPSWGIEAAIKVFERHKDHRASFADILAAAVTTARDPTTLTPARMFEINIHWPETAKRHLPRPPECPDHIGKDAHNCASCWADVKAGIRPRNLIGQHHEPESEEP